MDPYERRLRDEVVYLHSLWHQGPPRNPNPYPKPKHTPSTNLHTSNSTAFKKSNTTKKNQIKRKSGNNNKKKNSESEWPCKKPVAATTPATSGWLALKQPAAATARPVSAEEQARIIATQLQQKGLEACRGFFSRNVNSDSDDEEEDEDDFVEMDGCEECEEYGLFLKLFMEDSELRSYYEKNYEGGDFCCLVCGGIGKKVNKRFKNCVALVQHSTSISRTAKKRAHRAYGQVICKVLGWEINRLPTIVLSMSEPLGRSLAKSGEPQGEQKENVDGSKDNLSPQKEDSGVCQQNDLLDKSVGSSNVATGELMVCGNASEEDNGNINMEVFEKGTSGFIANINGSVNCSDSLKEAGVEIDTKITQEESVVLDGLKEDGANQSKDSLDKEVAEAVQVRIEETEH